MILEIALSAAAICVSILMGAWMIAGAIPGAFVVETKIDEDPQPLEDSELDLSLRKVEWDPEPVGGRDAA